MNNLQNELSPYLLQHKNNPVNWYPWCEEAFELAKKLNKPIFLSIGYSTCHWCHVMEKETFEDKEAADILNEVFVCIKVDREERPDIDAVYMKVCQMLTGSGGWPLTIMMTANKEPFFAGTYFPKHSNYGRIGIIELAEKVRSLWIENYEDIEKISKELISKLSNYNEKKFFSSINTNIFELAFEELKLSYDSRFGGFGKAPKFPMPNNISFLMRYYQKTKDATALKMCENTLEKMNNGGIYDHIGYGFHRYSTDEQWLVPHFEKMLYDQALLIMSYTEAYQLTKKGSYKKVAEEIIEYELRDMISIEGCFYSAEDADSEGVEGKYYVWSYDEILHSLDNPQIFIDAFGILPDGNYVEGNGIAKSGKNIIYRLKSNAELAEQYQISEENVEEYINSSLRSLFEIRKNRVPPFKDDKILTDWNGLMICALAKAGTVFQNQKYIDAAIKAELFIEKNLKSKDGMVLHRYREGKSSLDAVLDDYAYLAWAEIELYEATFDYQYLNKAKNLTKKMIKDFFDTNKGGFFFSSLFKNELPIRIKELYDGALPSGNSVAMLNLVRLWKYYQNQEYRRVIDTTVSFFSSSVQEMPQGYLHFLNALNFYLDSTIEIIIVGNKNDTKITEIIELVNSYYIPNKIILWKYNDETKYEFECLSNYKQLNNKATVYVCSNFSCQNPINDYTTLKELLDKLLL